MEMRRALPFVGMVLAECAQAGLIILSKVAMNNRMSSFILVMYSNALASILLLPASFLFRRSERPPLIFSIICGFFLLGLFGLLAQIFGYTGINLSSPTLGTAMLNLIPGFTFVLAVAFRRMEGAQIYLLLCQCRVDSTFTMQSLFLWLFFRGVAALNFPMPRTRQLRRLAKSKLTFQKGKNEKFQFKDKMLRKLPHFN